MRLVIDRSDQLFSLAAATILLCKPQRSLDISSFFSFLKGLCLATGFSGDDVMDGGTPDFLTLSLTDKSSDFLFLPVLFLPVLLLGVAVVAVAVSSLALPFFFFFTVLTLRPLDAKPLYAEAPSTNSWALSFSSYDFLLIP